MACLERLEERVLLTANSGINVGDQLALSTTAALEAQQAFTTALAAGQASNAGLQSTFSSATAQSQTALDADDDRDAAICDHGS